MQFEAGKVSIVHKKNRILGVEISQNTVFHSIGRAEQKRCARVIVALLINQNKSLYQPTVILSTINNVININGIISDLENQHIAFFKKQKPISIFRNMLAF